MAEFLSFCTMDILGQILICWGGSYVYFKMFSSILSLYMPIACFPSSSKGQQVKRSPDIATYSLEEKINPGWELVPERIERS